MAKKLQLHEFDLSKISVTSPQANKGKDGKITQGKTAYIRSKQFPDMTRGLVFSIRGVHVAHPLRAFRDDTNPNAPPKYSLTLSFGRDETGKPTYNIELYNALIALERRIIEILSQNSEEWMDEKLSTAEIKGKFNSFINKKNKNKTTGEKYPDTFRVRVLTKFGDTTHFEPRFFDGAKNNTQISIDTINSEKEIPRNTVGNIDVRISKLWISGSGMGVTFDLAQGSFNRPERMEDLEPPPPCTDEDAGRDREEDEESEIRMTDDTKTTIKPGKRPQVDDEDIEDFEDLDDKPTKKTTTTKKATTTKKK